MFLDLERKCGYIEKTQTGRRRTENLYTWCLMLDLLWKLSSWNTTVRMTTSHSFLTFDLFLFFLSGLLFICGPCQVIMKEPYRQCKRNKRINNKIKGKTETVANTLICSASTASSIIDLTPHALSIKIFFIKN